MINVADSRQDQILALLLTSATGLSIDEMAGKLDISRNAVKQHLVSLEKDNLIQTAALNNTGGRPSRNYRLTQQGINRLPKQYSWFCNLLLDEIFAEQGEAQLERMMIKMAEKLATSLAPQFASKNAQQRLTALIELMQQLGYHAELERCDEQTSVKALNCVYHDLAQQHPALCAFDRTLIAALLTCSVEQTACIAQQDCLCRFKIT